MIQLQFGLPGGPELLVLLLLLLFLFGVPLVLLAGGILGYRKLSGSDDRVAELERHVEELERELEAERQD